MSSVVCPDWDKPDAADKLPVIADRIGDFHRFMIKHARTRVLDHGDVKSWHGRIFFQTVPMSYYAGFFRSDDPQRPCLGVDVGVGGKPGAPFKIVPELMRKWNEDVTSAINQTDEYIRSAPTRINQTAAVLQVVAFTVGKLIQIHPFINGNGRMSRLTANYFLHRYCYGMLFQSAYPRPSKPTYADAGAACMDGDFKLLYRYILEELAMR